MRGSRRWAAGLAAAAVLCLGGGLVWAAAAGATRDGSVQVSLAGAAFTERPTGPLFAADGLAPGGATTAVLGVRSNGAAEELTVRLLPASGGGALAGAVRFAVDVGDTATGPFRPVWRGGALALAGGVATGMRVGGGTDRWVRLTAAVPASSGNEIAGATLRFGLRVQLGGPGSTGVSVGGASGPAGAGGSGGGVSVGGSGNGVSGGGLSLDPLGATGVPVLLLLVGAGLLGAAGGLLLLATCSRSGRTASP